MSSKKRLGPRYHDGRESEYVGGAAIGTILPVVDGGDSAVSIVSSSGSPRLHLMSGACLFVGFGYVKDDLTDNICEIVRPQLVSSTIGRNKYGLTVSMSPN